MNRVTHFLVLIILASCWTKRLQQKEITAKAEFTYGGILYFDSLDLAIKFYSPEGLLLKPKQFDSSVLVIGNTKYDVMGRHIPPILLGTLGKDASAMKFLIHNSSIIAEKGEFCRDQILQLKDFHSNVFLINHHLNEDTIFIQSKSQYKNFLILNSANPELDTFFIDNNHCTNYNHANFVKDMFTFSADVKITPNPFKKSFTVKIVQKGGLPIFPKHRFRIELLDLNGNLLRKEELTVGVTKKLIAKDNQDRQLIFNIYNGEYLVHSGVIIQNKY